MIHGDQRLWWLEVDVQCRELRCGESISEAWGIHDRVLKSPIVGISLLSWTMEGYFIYIIYLVWKISYLWTGYQRTSPDKPILDNFLLIVTWLQLPQYTDPNHTRVIETFPSLCSDEIKGLNSTAFTINFHFEHKSGYFDHNRCPFCSGSLI